MPETPAHPSTLASILKKDVEVGMNMWKEFKAFAVKGNAVDLAVGVVIGAAFGSVVASLVKDIITPPITLLTGGLNFADKFITLRAADAATKTPAVNLTYGIFLTTLINFVIVAFAIFMVIRLLSKLKKPDPVAAPVAKDCPFCTMTIPLKAVRCPQCTSELPSST